ncbi:MAG: glycoside hydrolase family 2 protein [Bacteroidetes bacterium]|nr:glycoside hydrolase family 2 protein [Bacteroidota bacterium]
MMKALRLFRFTFLLAFFFSKLYSQPVFLHNNWQFRQSGKIQWNPAIVPGTVHTDLLTWGMIPDPFFGNNEKDLQWIENEDWEYRTTFSLTMTQLNHSEINLVFEGLDTYAIVTLNGKTILKADNMFRTWKVEVKPYVKPGENELSVLFESASRKGKEMAAILPYTLPGDEKIFTRKVQSQYGWDWGPRFVTCGIWRPVYIEIPENIDIRDIHILQKSISGDTASLEFSTSISSVAKAEVLFTIIDKDNQSTLIKKQVKLEKGSRDYSFQINILSPRLWWPNGMGKPELYHFRVSLSVNNQPLSEYNITTGLRKIELVQDKDSNGRSFYFRVNGVPVFAKGANYIPPDNFLPRVDSSAYRKIINEVCESNMNMLRVWGGGSYENNYFYDCCDQNGILIWQDFMFACAMYPGDKPFLDNVSEEASDNVTRLRNHPCIALWCGNNEIDEGWHNWGWQKQYHYSDSDSARIWNDYLELFQRRLPAILARLDPGSSYWPSSPSIGWGHRESLKSGDAHYWGVWWGMEPFETYEKKVGRFMSEYGFQGFPDLNTFDRFSHPADQYLGSEMLKAHQKHPAGYETIQTYMGREYKIPSAFPDYVYTSQLLQANGIRRAIEAQRRAKPYCMGILYWQLNDCWPVVSWSGRDWYGRWKALQYTVKKAYEPFIVSIYQDSTGIISVHLINDNPQPVKGKLEINLTDFQGKVYWSRSYLNIEVQTVKNTVFFLARNDTEPWLNTIGKNNTVLQARFVSEKGTSYESCYYFAKPSELTLYNDLSYHITGSGPEYTLHLHANKLAKNVWIRIDTTDAVYSDNYFDLMPGQDKGVQIRCNIEPDILKNKLMVRTLALIH